MAKYLYEMSDHHVVLYEKKAEECLHRSESALNSVDKEAWLRLAEEWTKMAKEVGRRLGRE